MTAPDTKWSELSSNELLDRAQIVMTRASQEAGLLSVKQQANVIASSAVLVEAARVKASLEVARLLQSPGGLLR